MFLLLKHFFAHCFTINLNEGDSQSSPKCSDQHQLQVYDVRKTVAINARPALAGALRLRPPQENHI